MPRLGEGTVGNSGEIAVASCLPKATEANDTASVKTDFPTPSINYRKELKLGELKFSKYYTNVSKTGPVELACIDPRIEYV
jgi:hypothetical protein